MLPAVETPAEITKRWRAEGRTFRPSDVAEEFERQGREYRRARESEILAAAEALDPDDDSFEAQALRAVAEQIQDHRAAGNYTTAG